MSQYPIGQTFHECNINNQTHGQATIETSLHAFQLTHPSCCKKLDFSFFFRRDGEISTSVGYATVIVLDKTETDSERKSVWIEDIVKARVEMGLEHSSLARTMKALFDRNGVLAPGAADFADELQTNTILFVDELSLDSPWRYVGLGQELLGGMNGVLRQSGFSGTLLLHPAVLAEDEDSEDEETFGRVCQRNLLFYQNKGDYKVCWGDANNPVKYRLMCRKL